MLQICINDETFDLTYKNKKNTTVCVSFLTYIYIYIYTYTLVPAWEVGNVASVQNLFST